MKYLLYLAFAGAMLHAQVTITDTIKTPMGGNWSGTVQVTLNNPATAQPLYAGSETLSGWSQTVTVTNGAFTITLYPNDAITPTGTSYTARYTPTSGSSWSETWVCPTGATTIRELRSTTVPTPRTMFTPSQITQASATLGQALRWNGSTWAPAAVLTDPMTSTGDLITRSGGVPVRVGIGSTGQVLTVAGGLPTWAAPATNGTVTGVSVTTANGVSGTVANSTTTPAITLSLGAITPTSVAASGTVTGSNLSGTNTGDQTTITGNAGTATALAANPANCSAGTFPLGVSAAGAAEDCTALPTTISGTANQITASAATGAVTLSIPTNPTLPGTTTGTFSGNLTGNVTGNVSGSSGSTTGNAATATALQTARTIAGVSFNGTANISIPSTGLSDSSDIVRGGAAVATGQVLYGTSAGVAGSDSNLRWEPVNARLGVGISPAFDLHVSKANPTFAVRANTTTGQAQILIGNTTADWSIYTTGTGTPLRWFFGSDRMTLNTTGNLLLGTTTDDGSNRLQVAGSVAATGVVRSTQAGRAQLTGANSRGALELTDSGGANGLNTYFNGSSWKLESASNLIANIPTWLLNNETPTTGVTQFIVRAGAGQGSTNMTTWQNAAGTQVAAIGATGIWSFLANQWHLDNAGVQRFFFSGGGTTYMKGPTATNTFVVRSPTDAGIFALDAGTAARLPSGSVFGFSSTTNAETGTSDVGIARNAAGILEVNNGTAGTFRDLTLRAVTSSGYAFVSLPAATNGTFLYCSDCTIASPCASGGTGALAKRLNSTWVCN